MVAIRMTLSCGGIGVGAVCVGWSSALLVVVLMRSSVGWNGDSGCAPVVLVRTAQLSVPAHRSGPQWWRCDIGCSGVGGSEGDRDLDAADRGTVTRCRPVWALGWWCGGVGGCAVVAGAAGGVAQQGVGSQHLPQVVVGGLRQRFVAGVGVMGA